ncbi:MAG: membrane dipeptidase [Pseudomonadota bacterium]
MTETTGRHGRPAAARPPARAATPGAGATDGDAETASDPAVADAAGPPVAVFDGHNDTILRAELAARAGRPRDLALEDTTPPGAPGGWRLRRLDIDLPRARRARLAGGLFAMFTPTGLARADGGGAGMADDIAGGDASAAGSGAAGDEAAPVPDPADAALMAAGEVDQARALAFTMALFARLRRLARQNPEGVAIAADRAGIDAAAAAGRLAIVPHIEGAECIDTDLAALEILHAAGLRSLGPVWSRPNAFGHGAPMAAQPDLDPGEGLTPAGRALVSTCEAMGILVDCAHLTEKGFWDVAATTDQPLVASHSNAHAICPSARNLTDRQLDAVAERGGLVGLNFHVAFLRPDCRHNRDTGLDVMLRHLDHLLGRLGEEGVALGSDFDGCLLPREIDDVTGLQRLVGAMRRAGYGEALIARIARDNWLSLLGRVIG